MSRLCCTARTSLPTAFASISALRRQRAPVILIPGITSPAITWGFVAERLGRTLRCLRSRRARTRPVLDRSGSRLWPRCHGSRCHRLCAALGLVAPALLGHSMGARIAMRGGNCPAATSRVSFSSILPSPAPAAGLSEQAAWYVDSIRLALGGIDAEGMKAFCPTWTESQLQLRAEWLHTCYEPAIVTAFEDFHKDDIFPDFPDAEAAGDADGRRPRRRDRAGRRGGDTQHQSGHRNPAWQMPAI
jgi:N-formylmaleamate deformylase